MSKNKADNPKSTAENAWSFDALTDAEKQALAATAYHEAGHAVMALIVGRAVQKITIVSAKVNAFSARLGACQMKKGRIKPTSDWLEDEVLILFAGMVAESHFTNQQNERGAGQDLRSIRKLLAQNRGNSERQLEKLERRLLSKAEYLLEDEASQKAIVQIANRLLEKQTISGREATHLFEQAERAAKQ